MQLFLEGSYEKASIWVAAAGVPWSIDTSRVYELADTRWRWLSLPAFRTQELCVPLTAFLMASAQKQKYEWFFLRPRTG